MDHIVFFGLIYANGSLAKTGVEYHGQREDFVMAHPFFDFHLFIDWLFFFSQKGAKLTSLPSFLLPITFISMYRPDPHPDPYANQYPPPPPLAPEPHSGYVAPPPGPMPTPSAYMPPQKQPALYPPEGIHSNSGVSMMDHHDVAAAGHYGGGYNPPSFHSVPMTTAPQYAQHSGDPQAVTMEEYRQTEQHEQLYNSSFGHQQEHDRYYKDYRDEPDMSSSHTPMVQPPPLLQQPSSQKTIRPEDPDSYQPAQQNQDRYHNNNNNNNKYTAGPMVAPEDEAEAYRPKYYDRDDRRGSGCNCCCYNPAMTCCSCFCFLISLAFLAGGIALIIAAKVIGDKCNAQCGDVVDKAAAIGVSAQPCDAICGKVVHDGMFYGGIAIAGLAAIAAIWKVFMWMCAAGSRR